MFFDDALRNRQAKPRAAGIALRCEKWVKNARQHVRRDAAAFVAHFNHDLPLFRLIFRAHTHGVFLRQQRFEAVLNQIDHHLFQFLGAADEQRRSRIAFNRKMARSFFNRIFQQRDRAANHLIDAHLLIHVRRIGTRKIFQACDDALDAVCAFEHAVKKLLNPLAHHGIFEAPDIEVAFALIMLFQHHARALPRFLQQRRIQRDEIRRIVDFMRHAGDQRAERNHFISLIEFLRPAAFQFFIALAGRDVAVADANPHRLALRIAHAAADMADPAFIAGFRDDPKFRGHSLFAIWRIMQIRQMRQIAGAHDEQQQFGTR